jgi:hypothetical protein
MQSYEIAGIPISIEYHYPDYLKNNIESYLKEVTPKYVIQTVLATKIEPLLEPYMQDTYRRFYQDEHHHTVQVVDQNNHIKYEIKRTLDHQKVHISIVEALSKKPAEMEYIFLSMVFLDIATLEGFIPLHASCVIKNDEAYLFSAPSGTGKSTHAQFYQQALNGFILNDDKPIIKNQLVYGTPFSGKSALNQNDAYPLKAIYFIEQGSIDAIKPLDIDQASKKLLKNIARPTTKDTWEAMLPNINTLLLKTQIYQAQLTLNVNSVYMTYYEPNKETPMKIKPGFIIKTIGLRYMVLPIDAQALHFNGIMTLNKSGKRLFEALETEQTLESLTQLLMDHYEVSFEDARKDVIQFVETLKDKDLLC